MSGSNLIDQLSQAMQMKSESMPAAASYTANSAAVLYGAFTFTEWLALLGAVLGIATFFLNKGHQRRRELRELEKRKEERELHQLRMAQSLADVSCRKNN